MLPWNYGMHFNVGTVIFMGIFYTVLVVIATTLITAAWRSRKALQAREAEEIRWHSEFHDLAGRDRACRHELTGELGHRECPNGFDCRECETHTAMLEKRAEEQPAESAEDTIYGMKFPADRLYHRGHTWVRREKDGTLTVGLDELGRRLLGEPDRVVLPRPGERLNVHGTAWRARKGKAELRVVSPVAGTVIETGGPDGDWYLKIRPASLNLRHLLCGYEVRPWIEREIERLELALKAAGVSAKPSEKAVVPDFAASFRNADWEAVCGQMFLNA